MLLENISRTKQQTFPWCPVVSSCDVCALRGWYAVQSPTVWLLCRISNSCKTDTGVRKPSDLRTVLGGETGHPPTNLALGGRGVR